MTEAELLRRSPTVDDVPIDVKKYTLYTVDRTVAQPNFPPHNQFKSYAQTTP